MVVVESKVMKFAQKAVNKGKQVYKDVQKVNWTQEADQFFLKAEKGVEKGANKVEEAMQYVEQNTPQTVKDGAKKLKEQAGQAMQYVEENAPQAVKDGAKKVGSFLKGLFS